MFRSISKLAIIGGGCSGASVAIQQMWGISGKGDLSQFSYVRDMPLVIQITLGVPSGRV